MRRPLLIFTTETDGEEALICPYFRCATCGERITEARGAIAVFERGGDGPYTGELTVVHKGACDRFRGRPWRELTDLLLQLVHNSDVGVAEALRLCAFKLKTEYDRQQPDAPETECWAEAEAAWRLLGQQARWREEASS